MHRFSWRRHILFSFDRKLEFGRELSIFHIFVEHGYVQNQDQRLAKTDQSQMHSQHRSKTLQNGDCRIRVRIGDIFPHQRTKQSV